MGSLKVFSLFFHASLVKFAKIKYDSGASVQKLKGIVNMRFLSVYLNDSCIKVPKLKPEHRDTSRAISVIKFQKCWG
jgi:hypothetical protein